MESLSFFQNCDFVLGDSGTENDASAAKVVGRLRSADSVK
jgi:hypothetical protein